MEFRVCKVKPAEAGFPNNALQRGLPRPGMEFRVCQVKPAEAGSPNNALQRGCPAPEWNSGSARRGGLAEQRASARLPRPGMEFRVLPAEAGSPNNALQRGCPAPEWNSGSARRGGLADVTRFSTVCLCQIPSPAEAGSPT